MEQRLAEFRARKAEIRLPPGPSGGGEGSRDAEQKGRTFIQAAKEKIFRVCSKWKTVEPAETEVLRRMPMTPEDAAQSDAEPASPSRWKTILLLKFILWLVLLGLFVELEFGLAYFVLSMFYWIYEGTRGPGQRKKGERSAYSIFNPGCEAIQGTLTAEQFERELLYSPLVGT
ncbi:SAYSvFN domain-containing protein 1 [Bufo bufo]|uniref:SAYSvFN domain-containing protein 1 n=1 Tax=Bufo bufo TaxID=8384 RepID=UPI001ABEB28E|nr:SAYSvFN domain-containing protein 1 [Bufo bufo]